ncbi:MAG TPA: MBL fold metallo-hydrolase [Candidatus Nanoarchaeia archaeon]|nr:MBL fold metallo-hydrolase [Candidatus Nanoarchaeia archaeon]
MQVRWLGHASLKIVTGRHVIYIDPYAGQSEWYSPATIILVSRFAYDHCSFEKIKKISTDSTLVFAPASVARELFPCKAMKPGENTFVDDVEIVALPVVKNQTNQDALSFVILAENKLVYCLSDSDFAENLRDMKPDVLFVSLLGSIKHIAETVSFIAPKLAIPIHWGSKVGTRDDAESFKELITSPVQILSEGEQLTL